MTRRGEPSRSAVERDETRHEDGREQDAEGDWRVASDCATLVTGVRSPYPSVVSVTKLK
jgi:hypothetical protein